MRTCLFTLVLLLLSSISDLYGQKIKVKDGIVTKDNVEIFRVVETVEETFAARGSFAMLNSKMDTLIKFDAGRVTFERLPCESLAPHFMYHQVTIPGHDSVYIFESYNYRQAAKYLADKDFIVDGKLAEGSIQHFEEQHAIINPEMKRMQTAAAHRESLMANDRYKDHLKRYTERESNTKVTYVDGVKQLFVGQAVVGTIERKNNNGSYISYGIKLPKPTNDDDITLTYDARNKKIVLRFAFDKTFEYLPCAHEFTSKDVEDALNFAMLCGGL